jgi:hypothetical protein
VVKLAAAVNTKNMSNIIQHDACQLTSEQQYISVSWPDIQQKTQRNACLQPGFTVPKHTMKKRT